MCLDFCLHLFSETFFILRQIQRNVANKHYCQILIETWILKGFRKIYQNKIQWKSICWADSFHTDRNVEANIYIYIFFFFEILWTIQKNELCPTVTSFSITKIDQGILFRVIIFIFLLRTIKNIPLEKNAGFYNVNVRGTYGDRSSSVRSYST